jgi:N-acetylmuramoyl-L-alanine amidase
MRIAWSAGHDPIHSGAYSVHMGQREHFLALEVVNQGKRAIELMDFDWEMLYPHEHIKDPETKSAGKILREKIKLINDFKADIAIESHFNAGPEKARGCETLYFSWPGVGRFSARGKNFAELVQMSTLDALNSTKPRAMRPILRIRDRGAKGMASLRRVYNGKETFPRFAFLMKTKMPAVILEPFFISSPLDTFCLENHRAREIINLSTAIVAALMEWEKEL